MKAKISLMLKKIVYNKNYDPVFGLSASSYMEGKSNNSANREDDIEDDVFLDMVSDDDLDRLHQLDVSDLDNVSDDDLDQIHSIDVSDGDNSNEISPSKDFKFCHKCGTKLDRSDVFCCNCGTKLKVEIVCDNCGAKLKEGDIFVKMRQ